MTLQECYQALEGDYADVSARLPSERLVQKFVLKFLADPSYELLMTSLQGGDVSEAFRASHTASSAAPRHTHHITAYPALLGQNVAASAVPAASANTPAPSWHSAPAVPPKWERIQETGLRLDKRSFN